MPKFAVERDVAGAGSWMAEPQKVSAKLDPTSAER